MNQTLVIYDNSGKIFTQITGDYVKPVGLQHIEIEIPAGKIVSGVDVSVTPHQVILEDIPKSETELLNERLDEQNQAIAELTLLLYGGM